MTKGIYLMYDKFCYSKKFICNFYSFLFLFFSLVIIIIYVPSIQFFHLHYVNLFLYLPSTFFSGAVEQF